MTLKVGIVGCGDMGAKHASAWQQQANVRVVACCDLDHDRARGLGDSIGARSFAGWQEMLQGSGADVISICVPTSFHAEIAIAAVTSGCHVLCEKAIALTLEDADRMIAAADTHHRVLLVSHQYRSLRYSREVRRLIDGGRLGSPLYAHFAEMREVRPKLAMHMPSMNGGPFHDMAGHLIDMFRFWTGSEPLSVLAHGGAWGAGKKRLAGLPDLGMDTIAMQARFEGGHVLSINLSWGLPEGTPSYSSLLVHGPEAFVELQDHSSPNRCVGDVSKDLRLVVRSAHGAEEVACAQMDNGPAPVITSLIRAIETGETSEFRASEARRALALILAAERSCRSGEVEPI